MDVVVPFDISRERVVTATAVRSTWLASSIRALRGRGHLPQYLDAVPRPVFKAITEVSKAWLPMEVAIAHYQACDALELPTSEQLELGGAVVGVVRATSMKFDTRLATPTATPWTAFVQFKRMWKQGWTGGDVAVAKVGPKEAQVEVAGWPPAAIRYCRIAMRGLIMGHARAFCAEVYARDLAPLCTATTLGFHVRWA